MSNTNNLGELAFTAEDFDTELREWINGEYLAEHVNRILASKLARAPEVFHNHKVGCYHQWTKDKDCVDCREGMFGNTTQLPTFTARLVCVEKLEK